MSLFADYVQPVISWLEFNPQWALFITFFISFAESLAIIGSIVPGTVTMTAVGILAGSGIMRIDLTLIAATLGAIAGDGISYLLGYYFSDRLNAMWPFNKYPHWLTYGQSFFEKHGGKSVLIGRFVGPIRSIIPVIAGMMRMNHLQFYAANIVSAIGWAFLYVFPGFLIGAASNELSAENATRLFVVILVILVGIWFITASIRWLLSHLHRFIQNKLHQLWSYFNRSKYLSRFTRQITPDNEINHNVTASILFLFLLSGLGFILLTILACQRTWIMALNEPVHYLLQSIRTSAFDIFFIGMEQLISPASLIAMTLFTLYIPIYRRDWRALRFLISLMGTTLTILTVMHLFIASERPGGLWDIKDSFSFPAFNLTYAAALLPMLLFYLSNGIKNKYSNAAGFTVFCSLILTGFATIYLGDHWLTDVLGALTLGIGIALLHFLLYRHRAPMYFSDALPYFWLGVLWLSAAGLSFMFVLKAEVKNHQPYHAQYVFTDATWWGQQKPLLPEYRVNRFGKPVSYFNLQYAGSLSRLESSLQAFGWQTHNQTFYENIMQRLSGRPAYMNMPLIAQLYLNRKPSLVMTYETSNTHFVIELRIWRSNYHLKNYRKPIWIGSVHYHLHKQLKGQPAATKKPSRPAIFYVRSALPDFMTRDLALLKNNKIRWTNYFPPRLLLIKEIHQNGQLNLGLNQTQGEAKPSLE